MFRARSVDAERLQAIILRLELIDVSGHELDVGVGKGLSGLVVQRHPAHDIQQVAVDGRDHIVVGVPAHAAGDIAEFRIGVAGTVTLQQP